MSKTSTLHVRIDPNLKNEAEKLLKSFGISSSEAINMFYTQICLKRAIPFSINDSEISPNEVTKIKRKSLSGYLAKYANPSLIEKESGIWESEARE
jgi:DNA-damage-inducible protein J